MTGKQPPNKSPKTSVGGADGYNVIVIICNPYYSQQTRELLHHRRGADIAAAPWLDNCDALMIHTVRYEANGLGSLMLNRGFPRTHQLEKATWENF